MTQRSQADLIDSLTIALELASSFLERAQSDSGMETKTVAIARQKACDVILAVRRFESRIRDQEARNRINGSADELQTLLDNRPADS